MLQLAALEVSAIPVWLLDGERMRIVWANQGAANLSRARVSAGEIVVEEWTLYPNGVPSPVRLHLSAMPLEDGRVGLLNQALPSELARPDSVAR